jgi:hypothetical protein
VTAPSGVGGGVALGEPEVLAPHRVAEVAAAVAVDQAGVKMAAAALPGAFVTRPLCSLVVDAALRSYEIHRNLQEIDTPESAGTPGHRDTVTRLRNQIGHEGERSVTQELGPWSVTTDDAGNVSYHQDGSVLFERRVERTGGAHLVWSVVHGELLFIESGLAHDLARVWPAVYESHSVQQALDAMPAAYRERVMDRIRPDHPDDYTPEMLADLVIENEDIVEWPAQQMLGLLPPDVQKSYGKKSFSGVSGPCLVLDPNAAASIVAKLEQHGFTCERDDALCKQATGVA